jgi:hypothetical protein
MTMLLVDTTASEPCPLGFQGDTAPLVYFMSFAVAERYGALHPLAQAASLLRRQLRVDISPLMRFTSALPEGPEDVEEIGGPVARPSPFSPHLSGDSPRLTPPSSPQGPHGRLPHPAREARGAGGHSSVGSPTGGQDPPHLSAVNPWR